MYTPPTNIEAAGRVLGRIDLDPASSKAAHQIGTSEWRSPPDPPSLLVKFVRKLCDHVAAGDAPEALLLMRRYTDRPWSRASIEICAATCHFDDLVRFLDLYGDLTLPLPDQAIGYFGKDWKKCADALGVCCLDL
jgi:hypothetical protein